MAAFAELPEPKHQQVVAGMGLCMCFVPGHMTRLTQQGSKLLMAPVLLGLQQYRLQEKQLQVPEWVASWHLESRV